MPVYRFGTDQVSVDHRTEAYPGPGPGYHEVIFTVISGTTATVRKRFVDSDLVLRLSDEELARVMHYEREKSQNQTIRIFQVKKGRTDAEPT